MAEVFWDGLPCLLVNN